ncbi:4-hydroxybenzoate polyprenyltransferase [Rhizobium sp. BK602]|nr:4-hydroxybenzoate polyprenyltransferase [Rhizobium sp. BK602]
MVFGASLARLLRMVVYVLILGALLYLVLVAIAFYKINDWIDRCADQTSGQYIWHEAARKITCDNEL